MKTSKMKKAAATLLALSASGCLSQDTTGDTAQSEINRQNGFADKVESQYSKMKGHFVGSYNASDVVLTIDVARQNSTGNGDLSLVPQPTLIGSLSLMPKIFMTESGHRMMIPYPITGGQYVGGNDLTLTVQENGSPTTLHCKAPSLDSLDCNWYVAASTGASVSFTLTRQTSGELQAMSLHPDVLDGHYEGSSPDSARITAEFKTFLEPQALGGSSAVPQISVVGSFVIFARPTEEQIRTHEDPGYANFSFVNSQYDPISNTLAINITGSNPVVVNCAVRSTTSLHCSWGGKHGATSYEDFDLTKIN